MTVQKPKEIEDIALRWYFTAPFFYNYLQNMDYHIDNEFNYVAGVSLKEGKITLHLNLDKFRQLPTDMQKESVLMHEILHIVHATFNRCGNNPNRDVLNIASDACINFRIMNSTIDGKPCDLPSWCIFMETLKTNFGYKGKVLTEEIYEYLMKLRNESGQNGSSFGSGSGSGKGKGSGNGNGNDSNNDSDDYEGSQDGSGAGNGSDDYEGSQDGDEAGTGSGKGKGKMNDVMKKIKELLKNNIDGHDELDKADEVTKSMLQMIYNQSKSKGYGRMHGEMVEYINEVAIAKINWSQLLRRFINSTSIGGIRKNPSWTKPNRRNLPLQGKKKYTADFVVAIDTSGSISSDDFNQFFGEIESIIKNGNVRLLQCDTRLYDCGKYKKGSYKDIKIQGRGGTDLEPVFQFLIDNKMKNSKLIILTDGEMWYDGIKKIGGNKIETMWVLLPGYEGNEKTITNSLPNHKVIAMEKK